MKDAQSLLYDVGFSVALAVAAGVAGLIVLALVSLPLKRRRGPFLERLRSPLRSLVPAVFVSFVLPLMRWPKGIQAAFVHLVGLWIIGSIAWAICGAVLAVRDIVLSRYDFGAKNDLHARRVATQLRVIVRLLVTVIIIVATSIMLMSFSRIRQMGVSLLASAGVLSLIVGLAAQKTLGNVIAGIQIAFAQPIRLQDVVLVERSWGRIEEITLTYVVVRLWDLKCLILPISYFVDHPFENWTRRSAAVLGTVLLYADYTVAVGELRRELDRVLDKNPRWDGRTKTLEVSNATERAVELRVVVGAEDSTASSDLCAEVRERLLAYLQRERPDSLPRIRVGLEPAQGAPPEVPGTGPVR